MRVRNQYIKRLRMANFTIYKFRFPESLSNWEDKKINTYETAQDLLDDLTGSDHALILFGLSTKEDLLQIINFYQKKRTSLKNTPHTIVLVDFQNGGKLLEAAQRLSIDHFFSGEDFLASEESHILSLVKEIQDRDGKVASHQTYEDLFSGADKVVLKKNTKRRLYPVEEVQEIKNRSPLEVMTEAPVVTFRLYEGDKLIECEFVDYFDREIYLTSKVLPEDNSLTLEFRSSYLDEKKGLRLKTEVINIEDEDGKYQLTLRVESHLKEFEVMLKVFQKREQNIAHFLKKVKGH